MQDWINFKVLHDILAFDFKVIGKINFCMRAIATLWITVQEISRFLNGHKQIQKNKLRIKVLTSKNFMKFYQRFMRSYQSVMNFLIKGTVYVISIDPALIVVPDSQRYPEKFCLIKYK